MRIGLVPSAYQIFQFGPPSDCSLISFGDLLFQNTVQKKTVYFFKVQIFSFILTGKLEVKTVIYESDLKGQNESNKF